jgi:tRNA(Ile)-lysidine synthase
MAGLGPFEAAPKIAVAVSGGADSLALILLSHRWALALGGEATALCVDHGLRCESSAETRQIGRWMKARGISHRVLVWKHGVGRPKAALQAQARLARYGLLSRWCRKHGVLHLALGHHAGDQAETMLMRLARGGGPDGLAGMSAVASRQSARIVRPLLAVQPDRLRATLQAAGQAWIEDPSNSNPAFERVRWRRLIAPSLVSCLAGAAREIGEERCRRERELADLLAGARVDLAGFVDFPLKELAGAGADLVERALGRCLIAVGGADYAPRQESLALLRRSLCADAPARTLGGCRIVCRGGHLFVFREAAAAREVVRLGAGEAGRWDGRFDLSTQRPGRIARLGEEGWARLPAALRPRSIPREAALALPALWRRGRAPELPRIGSAPGFGPARFSPGQSLAPSGFTVAKLNVNII